MQAVPLDDVLVQEADFDIGELQRELLRGSPQTGASAVFVGSVRGGEEGETDPVTAMQLEHYPGMTQRSIGDIINEARGRWSLHRVKVIHRVGRLLPGDQIVYVGVSSSHRADAFDACEFIMDYLKTRAPFWKKEFTTNGERWVEARHSDTSAAQRWER